MMDGKDWVRVSRAEKITVFHESRGGPGMTCCGRFVRAIIFRDTAEEMGLRICKGCKAC